MSDSGIERVEHGGGLTAACARFGGAPKEWLDLSTGINPNSLVMPEIPASVWQRLPDERLVESAQHAAAAHYGVADGVRPLAVAGIQSAIQRLPHVTDGPVAVLGPTYEEYRHCFEATGRPVDQIGALSEVGPSHMVVVAVNPNNPDGRTHRPEDLLNLADQLAARGGTLVVDEAFADMRPDISLARHAGVRPGLVVFRSFGKFFGLAGMRLGFVLAEAAFLDRVDRRQGPWATSGPALEVARLLLSDADAIRAVSERIAERGRALKRTLEGAALSITGGTDLFVLVDDARAPVIHTALCQKHILTRTFRYQPNWIRFGLCPDSESDQRLGRALASMS